MKTVINEYPIGGKKKPLDSFRLSERELDREDRVERRSERSGPKSRLEGSSGWVLEKNSFYETVLENCCKKKKNRFQLIK